MSSGCLRFVYQPLTSAVRQKGVNRYLRSLAFLLSPAMASSAETQPLALPALQRALASSVSGGIFADTAYQLYSQ